MNRDNFTEWLEKYKAENPVLQGANIKNVRENSTDDKGYLFCMIYDFTDKFGSYKGFALCFDTNVGKAYKQTGFKTLWVHGWHEMAEMVKAIPGVIADIEKINSAECMNSAEKMKEGAGV